MLKSYEPEILQQWMDRLDASGSPMLDLLSKDERWTSSRQVLGHLLEALDQGKAKNFDAPEFDALRQNLVDLSESFAERGLVPADTAVYVFSLKEVFFGLYARQFEGQELLEHVWEISVLIDRMGLLTFETFSLARERIIKSQSEALMDLSTPVVQVWQGIIALPLVGTIDTRRAKDILENLLAGVVAHEADVVILDISGVPVVDTLVANRLMKTAEAVRLLGARAIITGINPVVAQTLVQLGVDLGQLSTKSSLRAGLEQAFRELNLKVVART